MMAAQSMSVAQAQTPISNRVARAGFVVLAAAALALLGGLALIGATTRAEVQLASQEAVRAAELRGTVAHLDELLLMVVRMAAASGDQRWTQRFEDDAPKLDAAISEADAMASPEIRTALAETTGEAHRDLLTMERRVLALAADGDLATARALIEGPEFSYLNEVYAAGLDVFGVDLRTLAATRAAELDRRAWMEAGGLGLLIVLLVSMGLVLRGHLRLRAAKAETTAVAGTDPLTGLPNRHRFNQDLAVALSLGRRVGFDHALLLVDFDRFKGVNEAHGHPAGDAFLRLAGERLRTVLPDGTRMARLGGDEFAILLRCGPGHPPNDPSAVAQRIVQAFATPFALPDGPVLQVGASIGVGMTRIDDDGIGDLMHRADVGLSRAKAEGRGCFRFFEQGTDARVRAQALLESEFRQAVAGDAIVPHFQPLVDIDTGLLVGMEMLARWPHPTRGMIPPDTFIPIAEETGLIGPMTVSLLRQGCLAAAAWPDHLTLACNVSPLQLLDPALPATIRTVLEETGFPAHRLEVEVTESALVGDLALARRLLDEIKALGARLALDDFGTGYSSLRHLQLLPFDKIKIDRSFVGAMVADRESAKIVSAVIGLGHSLGLSTVAEGVETEAVALLLRGLGCDVGQGWLFGRPVAAKSMDKLIAAERERAEPAALLMA